MHLDVGWTVWTLVWVSYLQSVDTTATCTALRNQNILPVIKQTVKQQFTAEKVAIWASQVQGKPLKPPPEPPATKYVAVPNCYYRALVKAQKDTPNSSPSRLAVTSTRSSVEMRSSPVRSPHRARTTPSKNCPKASPAAAAAADNKPCKSVTPEGRASALEKLEMGRPARLLTPHRAPRHCSKESESMTQLLKSLDGSFNDLAVAKRNDTARRLSFGTELLKSPNCSKRPFCPNPMGSESELPVSRRSINQQFVRPKDTLADCLRPGSAPRRPFCAQEPPVTTSMSSTLRASFSTSDDTDVMAARPKPGKVQLPSIVPKRDVLYTDPSHAPSYSTVNNLALRRNCGQQMFTEVKLAKTTLSLPSAQYIKPRKLR